MVAVTLEGPSRGASLRMRLCWEVVGWMDNYYEQTVFIGKYLRPGKTVQSTKLSLTFTSISLFDHSPELWDKRQNAPHVTQLSGRRLGIDITRFSFILLPTSRGRETLFLSYVLSLLTLNWKLREFVLISQMFSRSSQDLWARTSLGQKWNHIRIPN